MIKIQNFFPCSLENIGKFRDFSGSRPLTHLNFDFLAKNYLCFASIIVAAFYPDKISYNVINVVLATYCNDFVLGKVLLSIVLYTDNPCVFTTFPNFLDCVKWGEGVRLYFLWFPGGHCINILEGVASKGWTMDRNLSPHPLTFK